MRSFAVIATVANGAIEAFHDRMPVIVPPQAYERWLSLIEPDPRDRLAPYPSEAMMSWPVPPRVHKPDNDAAAILDRIDPPRRPVVTAGQACAKLACEPFESRSSVESDVSEALPQRRCIARHQAPVDGAAIHT